MGIAWFNILPQAPSKSRVHAVLIISLCEAQVRYICVLLYKMRSALLKRFPYKISFSLNGHLTFAEKSVDTLNANDVRSRVWNAMPFPMKDLRIYRSC